MTQPTHRNQHPFAQILPRPRLDRLMDHALGANLIVIGAARGWGKRTLARDHLSRRHLPVHWLQLSAADQPAALRMRQALEDVQRRPGPQIVVLEDVPADTEQDLVRLAVQGIGTPPPDVKVLLLVNRCLTGEELGLALPVQTAAIHQGELAFTREEIAAYFQQAGIQLEGKAVSALLAHTAGMAAALEAICQVYSAHRGWEPQYAQNVQQQLQPLFAWDLWQRTDALTRDLLIDMALAGRFTRQMLRFLHPEPETDARLDDLVRSGQVLPETDAPWYALQPQARAFLLDCPERADEPARCARIARWHLQQGALRAALACCTRAAQPGLLGEIAERILFKQLDLDIFQSLSDALNSVPEQQASQEPSLCCALCCLETLNARASLANRWRRRLEALCAQSPTLDNRQRVYHAQLLTAPDDVSLYHRFVKRQEDIAPLQSDLVLRQYTYMIHGIVSLPHWQRHTPVLKKLFAGQIEQIFGPIAEGIEQFWASHCHYERDQLSQSLVEVSGACAACETQKLGQLRAAIHLHLARVLSAYGRLPEATALLDRLAEDILAQDTPLPPALEPLRIHFALLEGDWGRVSAWMRMGAPDDTAPLHVLCADAFTIKAKIELIQGQPDRALVLLTRLSSFHRAGQRVLPRIHAQLLQAACLDRLGERTLAQQTLSEALSVGQRLGYVRVFADEGPLALGLLRQYRTDALDPAYRRAVRDAAQRCAQAYPAYGRTAQRPAPRLTPSERRVLELLAQGMSNQQIGQALDIRLPTVKNHASHIYAKLQVRSRSAAINAAKERGLLP